MCAGAQRNSEPPNGAPRPRGTAREASAGMRSSPTWLVLAMTAAMAVPSSALARGAGSSDERVVSACGRHVLEVARGRVFVDGRPVRRARGHARVISPPAWRPDGRAVAWVERDGRDLRLVVIPRIEGPHEALPWPLLEVVSGDRVFWAASNRVVVGPHLLAPRAVASWTEAAVAAR
jgi:hypothetical protein